ncbi:MAG TPA: hypothetical protein VNM48_14890 [Chloroflexota bacterium]|nr:hypothetical protein [Chloroflexota bacterium]
MSDVPDAGDADDAVDAGDEVSLSGLSGLSKTTSLKPLEAVAPALQILTPNQIESLTAIQDRLIPPEDGLPGAGESGAALRVDGLLAAQPNWRPDVLAALQAVDVASGQIHLPETTAENVHPEDEIRVSGSSGTAGVSPAVPGPTRNNPREGHSTATGFLSVSPDARDAVLIAVEAAYPRLFARLLRVTYTAYYTDAAVQRAHGQSAEPPLPEGYTLPKFDESRLEPVKRRGKLWRDA